MVTHDEVAEILFNYIRNIIYAPQDAYLAKGVLPPEYDKLIEGLSLLNTWLQETNKFSLALGNGDLNVQTPSRDNNLAAPLKVMYSNLKHLTWQTQEVAKGNYNQKVDFMGEFSEAFNDMTKQLKEREERIEHNMQVISAKNASLESAAGFFKQLVMMIRRVAICFDENYNVIFKNVSAEDLEHNDEHVYALLMAEMKKNIALAHRQISIAMSNGVHWYNLERVFLDWDSNKSYLYLAEDVTSIKEREDAAEKEASEDVLTGLYNRRYAMQVLQDSYDNDRDFSLAFIDLNRLKYMNDVYGHDAGDLYIKSMSDILKNIPWEHMAARVGGDEFLLLVYGADKEELNDALEELSTHFYLPLKDNSKYQVSFSYGVVQNDHKSSPSQLMRRADELMYRYKFSHKEKIN